MATATPATPRKTPATTKSAAKKPAPTKAAKPPAAPPLPAPVQAATSHQNTVERGILTSGATMTAATHKRRYKPGWKALIVVQDGTRQYRRIVGVPQASEEAAMLEAERVKAAFEKAGKIPA